MSADHVMQIRKDAYGKGRSPGVVAKFAVEKLTGKDVLFLSDESENHKFMILAGRDVENFLYDVVLVEIDEWNENELEIKLFCNRNIEKRGWEFARRCRNLFQIINIMGLIEPAVFDVDAQKPGLVEWLNKWRQANDAYDGWERMNDGDHIAIRKFLNDKEVFEYGIIETIDDKKLHMFCFDGEYVEISRNEAGSGEGSISWYEKSGTAGLLLEFRDGVFDCVGIPKMTLEERLEIAFADLEATW